MPLTPHTGLLGRRGAAHLLRRATYGPTINDIKVFSALTPAAALNRLYRPAAPLPDAPLPLDPDNGQNWVTGTRDALKMEFEYQEYFKRWFVGQMMSSGVPAAQSLAYSAREKLVFFIHTHLTAISEKIGSSNAMYYQNQLFRLYALDDVPSPVVPADKLSFKELVKKVCVDNAMLNLLDGTINIRGGNENFGRELLELYTIGRGLENDPDIPPAASRPEYDYYYYNEDDVRAAAKVFSGFQFDDEFSVIDPDTLLPRGKVRGSVTNASAHDNQPKQFSGHFNNAAIEPDPLLVDGNNATEESALDEISRFIDLVYDQDETPMHICRKIYRFFMYHEISPALSDDIIAEMASTFRANNFKIQPVIEQLLTSQHFYNNNTDNTPPTFADDAFGGIIKSPLDLILGTYRFFEIPFPVMSSDATGFYEQSGMIIDRVKTMGMDFYQPYDVAGYDAYHQFPIYHRSWITVNNLANRYDFIYNFLPTVDLFQFVWNNIDLAQASNARNLVIELTSFVLPVTENLTFDTTLDDVDSTLRSERLLHFLNKFMGTLVFNPEVIWAANYPTQTMTNTMDGQLRDLFNAMLQSPEYQLQ